MLYKALHGQIGRHYARCGELRRQSGNIGSLGKLDKAAYKVMEQFPEARYYQVVSKQRVREKLFLGSNVTEKAVIRAYKFKK